MAADLFPKDCSGPLEEGVQKLPPKEKSKPWWVRPLGLGFLVAAGLVAFWLGQKTKEGKGILPNGGLEIKPKFLDFGTAFESQTLEWNVFIHNPTNKKKEILDMGASCICSSIHPRQLEIPPGQTKKIQLVIDLSRYLKPNDSVGIYPFSLELIPYIKEKNFRGKGWKIVGKVHRLISIKNSRVDFGDNLLWGEGPYPTQEINIKAAYPITNLVLKQLTPFLFSKVLPQKNKNKEFKIFFTLSEESPPGRFEIPVHLIPSDKEKNEYPFKQIFVTGKIKTDIHPFPSFFALGPKKVGEKIIDYVFIKSEKGKRFSIIKWETPDPWLKLSKVDQRFSTFKVIVEIENSKQCEGKLIFIVSPKDSKKELKLEVPVYYHGFKKGE